VFWGTPSTLQGRVRGGRFPPLDRLDLLDYGRLLTGRDARTYVARPSQAELRVDGTERTQGDLIIRRSWVRAPRAPPGILRAACWMAWNGARGGWSWSGQ